MRRKAAWFIGLAALALAGCGSADDTLGGGAATVVPDPVPHEQALELIRDCRVTSVGGTHAGEMELGLEDGRIVSVADPDGAALFEAAAEAQERSCELEMYTE